MKNPFASKELPEPVRRRIELAIAVAQERLLATHVKYALELIELTEAELGFDRALDVYTRVLRLDADDSRVVTTQVLARLGERESVAAPPEEIPVEPEEDRGEHRSFVSQIRDRLRGRVREETRRLIELHAARTEVALLETHVDNAATFVEILEKEMPITEAAELYLEALEVRDSVAEVIYYITLDRVSDRFLPERRGREGHSGSAGLPQQPTAGR
ncbi:MAG TPA: hypothetical protein VMK65_01075 [Longimicrobiales bacterium]|nr:hypothetical protein [Longimicrobiales bacterium]